MRTFKCVVGSTCQGHSYDQNRQQWCRDKPAAKFNFSTPFDTIPPNSLHSVTHVGKWEGSIIRDTDVTGCVVLYRVCNTNNRPTNNIVKHNLKLNYCTFLYLIFLD